MGCSVRKSVLRLCCPWKETAKGGTRMKKCSMSLWISLYCPGKARGTLWSPASVLLLPAWCIPLQPLLQAGFASLRLAFRLMMKSLGLFLVQQTPPNPKGNSPGWFSAAQRGWEHGVPQQEVFVSPEPGHREAILSRGSVWSVANNLGEYIFCVCLLQFREKPALLQHVWPLTPFAYVARRAHPNIREWVKSFLPQAGWRERCGGGCSIFSCLRHADLRVMGADNYIRSHTKICYLNLASSLSQVLYWQFPLWMPIIKI